MGIERNTEPERIVPTEAESNVPERHTPQRDEVAPPPDEIDEQGMPSDTYTPDEEPLPDPASINDDDTAEDGENTEVERHSEPDDPPPNEVDEEPDADGNDNEDGGASEDPLPSEIPDDLPPSEVDEAPDTDGNDNEDGGVSEDPLPSEIPDDQESEHVEGTDDSPNVTDSDASDTQDTAQDSETSAENESNTDSTQADESTQDTGDTADTASETSQQETTNPENNNATAAENSGENETSRTAAETANASDETADSAPSVESQQSASDTPANTGDSATTFCTTDGGLESASASEQCKISIDNGTSISAVSENDNPSPAEKISPNAETTTDSSSPPGGGGPPRVPHEVQGEVEKPTSRFAAENFTAEGSFDAKAKEQHPELCNLKNKCVHDVLPMGTPDSEVNRTHKDKFTETERAYLKGIRDGIDAPTSDTVMQKAIGVDTGDITADLKDYLFPTDRHTGEPTDAQVFGYVSKAADTTPFCRTPQEAFDNLRLDYDETKFRNPEQPIYVIRYTDGENYYIPYGKQFEGTNLLPPPNAECGFTASKDFTIPEYRVRPEKRADGQETGAVVTAGEIYRVNPDGTEELVAYYDEDLGRFMLNRKEDEQ